MALLPTLARASLVAGLVAISGVSLAQETAAPATPAPAATAPAAAAAAAPAPAAEASAQAPAPVAAEPNAAPEAAPTTAAAVPPANAGDTASSTPTTGATAPAASAVPPPAEEAKSVKWSFDGPLGLYDRAALQRGYQVYKEVCSACHSLNRIAFRNLADKGGPSFSAAEAKALAAGVMVPAEPNDEGKTYDDSGVRLTRAGLPSDYFPAPFENEKAARAANLGALPPDLSIIVKARVGHSNYIYSLLTGFGDAPAGFTMTENMYYNPYFAGHQIAMPPPLKDVSITYADGTQATTEQMAHDVVTFLTWASEPKMEERKELGFSVMIYLLAMTGLLFLAYRRVWHGKH